MTVVSGYITQVELIARLDPNSEITETDAEKTQMDSIINAVSRMIDRYCGRKFFLSTETRYYTPKYHSHIFIDDLMSLTTLKTDEDLDYIYEYTWASTDYALSPYNAQSATEKSPYNMIEIKYNGNYSFPLSNKSVEIAGSWGYCIATTGAADATVPYDVKEACYLQCVKQFARKKTPNVVLGTSAFGLVQLPEALDPDVKFMLSPFMKRTNV
jgi:hypothetical protein